MEVFKAFNRYKTPNNIPGETASITKVNFQESKNDIINPPINWHTFWIIWPNFSPNPDSTDVIWAWTLVANSKEFISSNHPCSCFNIVVKYFSFKLWICLRLLYDHPKLAKKFATNIPAPIYKNL